MPEPFQIEPVRILLVEDEVPAAHRLTGLLRELAPGMEILAVLDSVSDTLAWLSRHGEPDLLFLDIHLADGSGLELFRQRNVDCPVIFTTAFDQYALAAFAANSIAYLLKPVQREELDFALAKFARLRRRSEASWKDRLAGLLRYRPTAPADYPCRVLAGAGRVLTPVDIPEIVCFAVADKTVQLHTVSGKVYTMNQTLDELEQRLDPESFYRISRQVLVNAAGVTQIRRDSSGRIRVRLQSSSPMEFTVSRERAASFRQWLGR